MEQSTKHRNDNSILQRAALVKELRFFVPRGTPFRVNRMFSVQPTLIRLDVSQRIDKIPEAAWRPPNESTKHRRPAIS